MTKELLIAYGIPVGRTQEERKKVLTDRNLSVPTEWAQLIDIIERDKNCQLISVTEVEEIRELAGELDFQYLISATDYELSRLPGWEEKHTTTFNRLVVAWREHYTDRS